MGRQPGAGGPGRAAHPVLLRPDPGQGRVERLRDLRRADRRLAAARRRHRRQGRARGRLRQGAAQAARRGAGDAGVRAHVRGGAARTVHGLAFDPSDYPLFYDVSTGAA
ncbi:hypothetical protein NKH77_47375 [Streptomyces sp. M19]